MGSTLATFRGDVAAAITAAGLPAYGHVPERITPPAAVVLPQDPYVAADETTMCDNYRVRLRVVILGARGTNQAAADAIDGHIADVLGALSDVDVENVSEPVEVELNGAGYLGAIVRLSDLVKVENTP